MSRADRDNSFDLNGEKELLKHEIRMKLNSKRGYNNSWSVSRIKKKFSEILELK